MSYPDIVRSFGFEISPDSTVISICEHAPVFHLRDANGEWIVKRSQKPLARGQAVAKWTRALAEQGLGVVTPATSFGDNPRLYLDGDGQESVWVVYPFITGSSYQGDTMQIHAAGDLLGKIHAAGAESNNFGLKVSETIVPIDADEIDQDIEHILQWVRHYFPALVDRAAHLLQKRTQRYFEQARPHLLATRLPLANCSWDYKGMNLVYKTAIAPVLIDPDNGACIPRTYDLAIAALLFHNEGDGPARLFTPAEWQLFLQGYGQHVQWTEMEKNCWDDILLCAWIDEALWLLVDDETGWADPRQSKYLLSLLMTEFSTFALSEE